MKKLVSEEQMQFRARLKLASRFYLHKEIAVKLGIPLWQVRNWLYINHPNKYTIKLLGKKIDRLVKWSQ